MNLRNEINKYNTALDNLNFGLSDLSEFNEIKERIYILINNCSDKECILITNYVKEEVNKILRNNNYL